MRRTVVLASLVTSAIWIGLTAVLLNLLLPPAVAAHVDRVRADRMIVVGPDGADQVVLRVGPGNDAGVVLQDTGNRSRAIMGIGDRADGLLDLGFTLRAETGEAIMRLGTVSTGQDLTSPLLHSGNLVLRDAQGQDHLQLLVADDGTPAIRLFDAQGTLVWSAP